MLFPDTTAAASSKVNTGTNTKVGVGSARASDNDDEELTLFGVVFAVLRPDASLKTFVFHLRCANSISNTKILISGAPSSPDETDTPQIVRRRWLHPSGTWRFTTWLYILRLSIVSTDGGGVYQWGDGFFAQESASRDRKPVQILRGKVCLILVSLVSAKEILRVVGRSLFLDNGIPTNCCIWHGGSAVVPLNLGQNLIWNRADA